jgi:transcriptional regulator with XRE-family HTH domain
MSLNPILLRLGLTAEQVAAKVVRSTAAPQSVEAVKARAVVRPRVRLPAKRRELPTPEVILQIRERVAAGERQTKIAFELGLSRAQVCRIVRGNSYQVDPGPVTRVHASRAHHKLRRLSADEAQKVRELGAVGMSVGDMAARYRVDRATISSILRGDSYADCGGPILYTQPRARMGGAK